MQIGRAIIELTGWPGAPGVNVLHWAQPLHVDIDGAAWQHFREGLHTTYTNCAGAIAAGVTVTIPNDCHVIEVSTGDLVGVVHADEVIPPVVGSGAADLSRASQMLVQLHTGDIRKNRLVRGRVNLGPMSAAGIGSDGNVLPAFRTNIALEWNSIADPLGQRLGVWSRPTTPGGSDGQFSDVTSCTVWEKPAVLRSRRD